MSNEIKMIYADVEEQLNKMESKKKELFTQAAPPITGNSLDAVTKLNDLGQKLETLLVNYQKLFMDNIETSRNSIEFMRTTDETISKNMNQVSGMAVK